ncbi:hypothetical protein HMPREF9550_00964 [Escherichia coli MS 187-1]|nr:hypothetical protein HMPREF9550_00964 [Escherichia coli MS 187-1]
MLNILSLYLTHSQLCALCHGFYFSRVIRRRRSQRLFPCA